MTPASAPLPKRVREAHWENAESPISSSPSGSAAVSSAPQLLKAELPIFFKPWGSRTSARLAQALNMLSGSAVSAVSSMSTYSMPEQSRNTSAPTVSRAAGSSTSLSDAQPL